MTKRVGDMHAIIGVVCLNQPKPTRALAECDMRHKAEGLSKQQVRHLAMHLGSRETDAV